MDSFEKHLSLAEQAAAKEKKEAEKKKKKAAEKPKEKAAPKQNAPKVVADPNKDGMLIEEVVEDAEVTPHSDYIFV